MKMTAETNEESDAVKQSFPALTYGVQKFVTAGGVLQADQSEAKLARTYKITRDNALLFPKQFAVPNALAITKAGSGRLHYSTSLQCFTTEENIAALL